MKTVAAKNPARHVVALGQYVVSDSAICHGAVTFKGTRCLVADALELLAEGLTPHEVCAQFHGWTEAAAVLEAERLANDSPPPDGSIPGTSGFTSSSTPAKDVCSSRLRLVGAAVVPAHSAPTANNAPLA